MRREASDRSAPSHVQRALAAALGLALALTSSAALADARVEARRHFKAGMAMIQAGQVDDGIAELQQAYEIKPHPNVLFNIAKAYQNAGKTPEAITYFKRYLASEPPDAASVEQIVDQLEASQPKPEPEPKRVEPKLPPTSNTPTLSVDEETLRKLAVLTERLENAVTRAEKTAEAPPAPKVETPAAGGGGVANPAVGEEEEGAVPYEETVVTASRRAQSTLEAPNSTTVITAEEIQLSGAHTLPDLLRRVPGAEVMDLGVQSSDVSFRGFNQRLENKVLVLIDGRPEYEDFLGITLWPVFPIGLEEIERIEVIRGPGSALYGANAMLGVINIITRSPGTGPRGEFTGTLGTGNTAEGSFVASGGEKGLRYRASVGYQQTDKWTKDFADNRPDWAPMTGDSDLALRSARANVVTHYAFSRTAGVSLSGGINRLYTEAYPLGVLRNFYLDGLGSYVKADLFAGPVKVKAFWNHLEAVTGPQYEPIGQPSLKSDVDANIFDAEMLFDREFELGGTHHFTVGISGRLKRLDWTFMGGLRSETHAAAFAQDEWKIFEPLRLQASYRVDRHPLLDNGQPGYAQSPRVSLLWLPVEGHALRASFATAFREPTFLESYTQVRVPVPGVNGASALTTGNTSLKAEQLIAYELGYRGELARLGLDWDIALYLNDVSNLVVLTAPQPLPAQSSFDPQTDTYVLGKSIFTNETDRYTARGIELGAHWSPVDRVDLRASAAFQQITSSNNSTSCIPCTQAPAVKLWGGATFRSPANIDIGLDAAYVSSTIWVEREPAADNPTEIAFISNPLNAYAVINARVGYTLIPDKLKVAIIGSNLGNAHQEHPFGNLTQRRVMMTVTVTP